MACCSRRRAKSCFCRWAWRAEEGRAAAVERGSVGHGGRVEQCTPCGRRPAFECAEHRRLPVAELVPTWRVVYLPRAGAAPGGRAADGGALGGGGCVLHRWQQLRARGRLVGRHSRVARADRFGHRRVPSEPHARRPPAAGCSTRRWPGGGRGAPRARTPSPPPPRWPLRCAVRGSEGLWWVIQSRPVLVCLGAHP